MLLLTVCNLATPYLFSYLNHFYVIFVKLLVKVMTRMWAIAQRDGRPAEYQPSVQRREVWLTPTARTVTLPRREIR